MNILCATDLQAKSDPAIARAHRLRKSLGARLTLLHVVPTGDAHEGTLEQRLLSANSRLAVRARGSNAPVELLVRCGRPAAVLRDVARARRADLLIVGPHVRDTVGDALRGTLTERIVGDAHCPVLIVRRESRGEYRNLLLALDGSATTPHIVRAAESVAVADDARLTAVHAYLPPYESLITTLRRDDPGVANYVAMSLSQAAQMIRDGLQEHSREPKRYQTLLVEARPVSAILRAAAEVTPDLLVMGTRGQGRFARALLGSTAHEALHATDCDVLLVPDAMERAARRAARRAAASGSNDPGAA